ncbi:E3 SUMO-protein ligase RanBP2 isoform X2 [Ceratina calcarata]|uniref:Nuclear pore complex protein Nup153 n=1 Tax=Ceratina calcarata TaxID=156304 RepID=A0AAJ7ISV8_9HYME|nr:E3 SUMO-protein ligase RanBP2 isoform X2 [Ceratina calcarata]
MFRTKKDVDRHVKDIFIKLKNPEEKNVRCYNIAKLYYQVGDYESARKYVSSYLEVRDGSAGAHKLLGQAFEALGQKEAAFRQYRTSLELEPKQNDLLLKVCELLSVMDINMDVNKIKYWIERVDKAFPHHPVIFELKEKMLNLEKPNGNYDDLEKLITSELSVRQTDIYLQIKLLKHYIEKHRYEDAYNRAIDIEGTHSYRNNIVWYQALSELLLKCKETKRSEWTFWIFYISVLERCAALCIKEQGTLSKRSIIDVTQAVFNFDQNLSEFKSKNFSNNPTFIEHMLLHMWGQLHFHIACLLLRKAKAKEDSWSEAGRMCGPLLLTALHTAPIDPTAVWIMHLKDKLKNVVHVWYREGSYRCSQVGHVLLDYARENTKKLLDRIDKYSVGSWREQVYRKIFIGRLYQESRTKSYFVNALVTNPPLRLCSYNELKRYDEISEEVWPDSLHHQVWLGLRTPGSQNKSNEPHPNQTSRVFCELQFSVYNLHQAAPDGLSRLDIDAFLNATIFCSASILEEQHFGLSNPEELPTLPADLTNTLASCAQEQWWSYAYKVYCMDKQKPLDEDLGELRLHLQRGLEVVRCLGNHGLHPVLLVHLARIFHYRAKTLKEEDPESSDVPDLEARSEMYWTAAIPLLERLQNNQTIRITNSKFFNYQGRSMNDVELNKALEEGKLLLAQRFVRNKQYEKAIDALQALKCPEASFQQGQMYEKLADEIINTIPKESLTSDMRAQHIIMLSKARECFYLTLDRLRSPGTNLKHPLNSELSTHITDIENRLKKIDPDLNRGDLSRNECDGMSDESYSSAHSAVDQAVTNTGLNASVINMLSTPHKNAHRTPKQSSTPYRPQHQDLLDLSRYRSEARPSPERLDAQIRSLNQMIHSKDGMIQSITEQNKTILELNKSVMEKVDKLAKEVAELRREFQKQRAQPITTVVPNLEEDLFPLNEDDYNELNYNANQAGAASSISGNMFQSPRHPYSQLVYPPAATFQGYYPGMSFNDPNSIPSLYPPSVYSMPVLYPNANANTRSKMPENILQQGLFMPPANQPLQIPLQKIETSKPETTIKDAPVNKVPPVNVAITISDTLPTTAPVVQPTLSVTIPPQFRQGSSSTSIATEQSVPHCYQISMPSQATIPTTVNLPPLSNTITTTPATISVTETPKQDTTVCSIGSPNTSDHEHDPIPDFVPVIPLPAEVAVTTGEEGQETLFCARAKLYRFVDNEWKERGVGNVKLLMNEEGKVRLLMRREQVLKVCANHYLMPDMELTAKSNNEKAWFWVANDFADGESKVEMFSIKFKTVEEGLSFKEHFDKAKANLPQSLEKIAETTTRDKTSTIVALNTVKKTEKTKPEAEQIPKQSAGVITPTEIVTPKTGTTTTVIGGFSFSSTPTVQKIATVEPVKPPPKTDISPFASFTFNKAIAVTNSESFPTAVQKSTTSGAIVTSQFNFSFGKPTTALQTGIVSTAATTVSSYSAPITSSQQANVTVTSESVSQFSLRRPHVPASAAIVSTIVGVQDASKFATQNEHEETLFNEKIDLQYYNSDMKQWENRGTGQIKILWSSKSNKIRLLMIDETSSKICYNYNISAKSQFNRPVKKDSNMVVSWIIQYGADNLTGMFAASFKIATQAIQFHSMITEMQQKMVKDCITAENVKKPEVASSQVTQPSKTQASLSEMFKPAADSWECSTCYLRNNGSDVKCVSCEAVRPSVSNKSATVPSNQVPLSQLFKQPAGSWKCKTCDIVNTIENNYCVACDTPKDPSLPPKPKIDGFQISTNSSGAALTFGIPQDASKQGTTGGFSFRFPASTDVTAKSDAAKTDTSAAKFSFGVPQNATTNKETTFVFGVPGKSFGFNLATKTSPVKSGGEENSEEEVEESDDIYFPPAIPLPDKIEIKTGEEDEEVLYSHRAKLFRYDKSTCEWKERGLGDIKLLRHRETGKLRLVMRREQILKLCLNHFVFPDLELKQKDEKTWMWNAADYSDGEIEHTLFACRFKTADIANSFKDIIDESKKKVSPVETATEVKDSPTRDIEVLYEMKVTPEEKQDALKLQLPENFYAYKQKPDCLGCRGCRESSVPLFPNGSSEKSFPTTTQFPPKSVSSSEVITSQPSISTTTASLFDPALYNVCSPFGVTTEKFGSHSDTSRNQQLWKGNDTAKKTENIDNANEHTWPQTTLQSLNPTFKKDGSITTGSTVGTTFSFAAATSTTPTMSIFGTSKVDMGKNIFGGTSKKDPLAIMKPSSLSGSANDSEPVFSNSFNAPPTTTTNTRISTLLFGSTTSPSLTTTTGTITFGTGTEFKTSVFPNMSTPFTFNAFSNASTAPSPFTTSTPATTNSVEAATGTSKETEKDVDVTSYFQITDVSFSTLAAKSSPASFKSDPNFSFADAGAPVFGSKSNVASNKSVSKEKEVKENSGQRQENEDEDCEQNENDSEGEPHFDPVVPLPDIIEVRTGEEDEEKVFCERAKLYRYDNTTREWKERGVGDMKILHHAIHGTYRLLLRRDQVHKVVCNLLLTPEIQFSELSSSDRAWVWAGMNYAEEQSSLENLAVKFKTSELAKNFKAAVDKVQQILRESRKE